MAVITPLTGIPGFSRIVPVPSAELEKLPPASPLDIPDDSEQKSDPADSEDAEVNQLMRWTPSKPPGGQQLEQATPETESTVSEEAQVASNPREPGEAPELGSQLDLFV